MQVLNNKKYTLGEIVMKVDVLFRSIMQVDFMAPKFKNSLYW